MRTLELQYLRNIYSNNARPECGELMRLITSFTVYMHIHIKLQEMAVKIIAVICHCVGAMFDKLQHHTWTAFKLTEQG